MRDCPVCDNKVNKLQDMKKSANRLVCAKNHVFRLEMDGDGKRTLIVEKGDSDGDKGKKFEY
jgi:hypothetical protein